MRAGRALEMAVTKTSELFSDGHSKCKAGGRQCSTLGAVREGQYAREAWGALHTAVTTQPGATRSTSRVPLTLFATVVTERSIWLPTGYRTGFATLLLLLRAFYHNRHQSAHWGCDPLTAYIAC